jgi:hypothetical protein
LLIISLGLSGLYLAKQMIWPKYKSEFVVKSFHIRMDQMKSVEDLINNSIQSELYQDKTLEKLIIQNDLRKISIQEIKPDITSLDKDDKTKFYRFEFLHQSKPKPTSIIDFDSIVSKIKLVYANNNDILEGKQRAFEAFTEIDSLVEIAKLAGQEFKQRANPNGNMMVMNDLYQSLGGLLNQKNALKKEYMNYKDENLLYIASPVVQSKKLQNPFIIPLIGLAIWALLCVLIIGFELVFKDIE